MSEQNQSVKALAYTGRMVSEYGEDIMLLFDDPESPRYNISTAAAALKKAMRDEDGEEDRFEMDGPDEFEIPDSIVRRIRATAIQHHIFGDYVISPVPNAFNGKTSFWVSKKGYAVSHYCFSIDETAPGWENELEKQLNNADSYIQMFKLRFE